MKAYWDMCKTVIECKITFAGNANTVLDTKKNGYKLDKLHYVHSAREKPSVNSHFQTIFELKNLRSPEQTYQTIGLVDSLHTDGSSI